MKESRDSEIAAYTFAQRRLIELYGQLIGVDTALDTRRGNLQQPI